MHEVNPEHAREVKTDHGTLIKKHINRRGNLKFKYFSVLQQSNEDLRVKDVLQSMSLTRVNYEQV